MIVNSVVWRDKLLQECRASCAGGQGLLPESSTLQITSWLDWEETVLRSRVTTHDSAGIQQAVQHLVEALGSRSYLVGSSLTLADVVIYTALFPVQVGKHALYHMSQIAHGHTLHQSNPTSLHFIPSLQVTCAPPSNVGSALWQPDMLVTFFGQMCTPRLHRVALAVSASDRCM